MKSFISEILSDFISIIFPAICLGCSRGLLKGEELICGHCISDLPKASHTQWGDNMVRQKFEGRLNIRTASAFLVFRKRGIVQKMLHAIKYKNEPTLAIKLGAVFGSELKNSNLLVDYHYIIPVPLHRSRLRQRGYNQSEKFAEGLSSVLGIPIMNSALIRITPTKTQTQRTKLNRWENVKEVFHINDKMLIKNKRILLVDDVITTGATLEACSHILVAAGCEEIGIACIAVA